MPSSRTATANRLISFRDASSVCAPQAWVPNSGKRLARPLGLIAALLLSALNSTRPQATTLWGMYNQWTGCERYYNGTGENVKQTRKQMRFGSFQLPTTSFIVSQTKIRRVVAPALGRPPAPLPRKII